MEILSLLVALILFVIWLMSLASQAAQRAPDGTFEEREKNPNLSTNDWEQHQRRLNKFSTSIYRRTTFYVGPKGGVYYLTARGTKVYC